MILNRLLHTRRIERCLVVAPDVLTVQWLGELWRKYHQVFTLLDGPRLADVRRDFGAGFNPFDVHRRAVRLGRDAPLVGSAPTIASVGRRTQVLRLLCSPGTSTGVPPCR